MKDDNAQKPVVLIVDDSPSNIMVLAACLKNNYKIKVAKSGRQCLDIVELNFPPDLILLDIEMPGMDGYEVCQYLKDNTLTASIPIIFVTGKNDDEDQEKGLALGAVDYIVKPIRPVIVAARVKMHITLNQQHDKLENLAMRDQLTNLYNRHYLLEVANHKVAQSLRHKHHLCLLMVDIDHFKLINDNYGHPVGDIVLQKIAALLQSSCRKEDVVARFGGEEFIILLEYCDMSSALLKASEIINNIEYLKPNDLSVTASIGVAELIEGKESFSGLLKRADIALYQAKDQGRNRVVNV